MCEYLSFLTTWVDGEGLQAFAAPNLKGHSEAVQLWQLPDDARRWTWEQNGEANLVLSHGQEMTPEREAERLEILRLWPTRNELSNYLIVQALAAGKVGRNLNLSGCTGLEALPDGLSVKGDLDLRGCTGLEALPDGLSVGGYLDLRGCTGLTALPDSLSVGGDLDLSGCTGLAERHLKSFKVSHPTVPVYK